jgi:hypothetical protein
VRRRRLALGWVVAAGLAAQGAAAGEIRGRFSSPEQHPLAAALVTLYAADTDLLVDFTYSRDDGRFTLEGPPEAGNLYLLATRGEHAAKSPAFPYDPEQPTPEVMLEDRPPGGSSWLAAATPQVLDKGVNALVGSVIGLSVGLGFKIVEDRKRLGKSRARYFGEIRLWAARLDEERREIEELLGRRPAPEGLPELLGARGDKIRDDAGELERLLSPGAYVEQTGRWRTFGSSPSAGDFQALAALIGQVKSLAGRSGLEKLLTASSEKRAELLAPIERLQGEIGRSSLLQG